MKSWKPFWSIALLIVLATALKQIAAAGVKSENEEGKIVFVQGIDNPSGAVGNIFTINPDGTDLRQLTSFGSSGGAGVVAWCPDGRFIVFQFFSSAIGTSQIWEMNADGSNQHLLINDPAAFDLQPSFSPDGSHIIFTRCEASCAIFRVNSDGTGFKPVTHFNFNPDVADFDATYSPDGSTVAFTSLTRGGLLSAIYLVNADGSNIRLLTPPELAAWDSSWSPDGSRISFSTNIVAIHDEEIWLINVDGTNLTQLTNNNQNWNGYLTGAHDSASSWSPEGDTLVFERDAPDFGASTLYLIKPDGTDLKALYTFPGRTRAALRVQKSRNSRSQEIHNSLRALESNAMVPRWGPDSE